MADRTIIVLPGQTLEDIALMEYGSVDAVFMLVRDNREVLQKGFSSLLVPGSQLVITAEPIDLPIRNALRALAIVPTTGELGLGAPPLGEWTDHHIDDYNNDHG